MLGNDCGQVVREGLGGDPQCLPAAAFDDVRCTTASRQPSP